MMIENTLLFLSIGIVGALSLILVNKAAMRSREVIRIPVRMDEDAAQKRIDIRRI
jgi:hypothetical protein